jgi:serine/threonine protein kinase
MVYPSEYEQFSKQKLNREYFRFHILLISSSTPADELRGFEWHTRYQIIKGICYGLLHLHKEKRILHMDLKPGNILLNDEMVPKITDFGLSRIEGISHTTSAQPLLSP